MGAKIAAPELKRPSNWVGAAAGYTYTKPSGDTLTAIDTWSRDLFVSQFSIPRERICVTSTPRFDYLAKLSNGDPEATKRKLGIPVDCSVVFFAAQHGLDEETKALAEHFAGTDTRSPIYFCIKLHPRTSDRSATEIQNFVVHLHSRHTLRIVHHEAIEDLLTVADVVVTIYSNVGIEATILGRPLLIANLQNIELPLPLDKLGIGLVAHNRDEVQNGIRRLIEDPCALEEVARGQRNYLSRNTHLRDGGSAETITDLIVRSS